MKAGMRVRIMMNQRVITILIISVMVTFSDYLLGVNISVIFNILHLMAPINQLLKFCSTPKIDFC